VIKKYVPKTLALPPTAYPIPNSSFILFDQRKVEGITLTGALLGPLGIMLQSEAGKTATSAATGKSAVELFDLDALTEQILRSQTQDSKYSQIAPADSIQKPAFIITTNGWINLVSDKEAKITIVLQTTYIDATDTAIWRNQYAYHSAIVKPITGSGGWLEDNNALLRVASTNGLRKTLSAFLKDINLYHYANAKEVRFRNCLPGARKLILLETDKDALIVRAQYNQTTGTHTQILDPNECQILQ
jgi:hypothetical protein